MDVILAEMVWFMSLRAKSGDGKNGEGIAQIESFLKNPLGFRMQACVPS